MTVAKRKIGSSAVHPVGLGCMNLSHAYGPAQAQKDAVEFLRRAIDIGYDFLDTATIYGLGNNEKLIGEALKGRRNEFVLASKCVMGFKDGKRLLDARPETIKRACEASLERLQTEVIDLYYMHRPDPNVPIEDSVGALADLVSEGKIRMIGLSEMSADTLRLAHAVHPISAMQSEYSLMTRNPEIAVLDACRELGVTFVPFSPVGRGYLADEPLDPNAYHETDLRRTFPRFTDPHFSANLGLLEKARLYAGDLGCTIAQLAMSVVAPALHAAASYQCTRNERLRCFNCSDTARQTNNRNRGTSICVGAITNLPFTVATPALCSPCGQSSTV